MYIWIVHRMNPYSDTAKVIEIHINGVDAMKSWAKNPEDSNLGYDGPFLADSFQIGDIISEEHLELAYSQG